MAQVSESICTFTGSPQGCVLCPSLFILYTNRQSGYKNRSISQYADDSVIATFYRAFVESVMSLDPQCLNVQTTQMFRDEPTPTSTASSSLQDVKPSALKTSFIPSRVLP